VPQPKYVPKHRNAPVKPVRNGVRNAALMSGVAVAATGIAVSSGVLAQQSPLDSAAMALSAHGHTPKLTAADLASRERQASRSTGDRRARADALKAQQLSSRSGVAHTRSEDLSSADPKTLARALMPQFGMSSGEFGCLDSLWTGESGWNVHADNPSSSAYGIPQALPGSKMASAGPDWENNPETQIKWGLGYIQSRYGTACSAWSFKQGHGWY
jgi:hypothetical protein